MRAGTRLGLATALAMTIAAPLAFAQEGGAPATVPGQMMPDQGMMSGNGMMGMGNMQGMMAMMQMMQQMGPMMEACTGMMQAMATQPATPAPLPEKG